MLPGYARLRRSQDIVTTLRQGKAVATPYVRAHLYQSTRSGPARVACIVGKKVHASAVQRHRYQRWLRECAKALYPSLETGSDLVLVGQPQLVAVESLKDLLQSLDRLRQLVK